MFLLIITSHVFAQNKSYDFINEKLETDSLFKARFVRTVIKLDSNRIYDEAEFGLYMAYSTTGNSFILDWDEIIKLRNAIRPQLIKNNKQIRFKKGLLHKKQKKIRDYGNKKRNLLSMSYPLFFNYNSEEFAIIEVSIIFAPLFGSGYIEVYHKKDGKWVQISQPIGWMS